MDRGRFPRKSQRFIGGLIIPATYIPAERRLVAEWATETYPRQMKFFNLRVGAGQPTLESSGMSLEQWRGTVGLLRRFVDCLVVLDDELLSVEAKIVAKPDAIGQLLLYQQLIPHTPELMGYMNTPVRSLLLCAIPDPAVTSMARTQGIDVVTFNPPWVGEYLATRAHRQRRAPELDAALQNDSTEA